MIFCARATRGLRRPSFDARSQGHTWSLPLGKAFKQVWKEHLYFVGRAQWKINQPPSLKRYRASLEDVVQGRAEISLHPARAP